MKNATSQFPDPASPPEENLNRITTIAGWSLLGVVLCFILVLLRIVQLQVQPSKLLVLHAARTDSVRIESALRGDLCDRRGRVLATSRRGWRLFADPSELEDPYGIAVRLAEALEADPLQIDKRLQARLDTRYVRLLPLLTDRQVDLFAAMGEIPGVRLEEVPVRHQPFGITGAALVGKVGFDQAGLSGMERILNTALSGETGRLEYLRDSRRRALWIEPTGYEPAQAGELLRLSIDIEIQRIVEEELTKAVEDVNAGGGRVVVLDPRTGELLAMANLLRERPDWESFAVDPGKDLDPALGRLRCLSDPYEPGSTFKPFIWAAATELGIVDPKEILDTHNGLYYAGRRRIRDSHPYEKLDWETVLIKSSNIGMAKAAERMTVKQMQNAISRFGFGQATACGLPGETAGIVTSSKNWTNYSQLSVSFGQEIAVTPLQMVRAFSAFAHDGTLPTIHTLAVDHDFLSGELVRSQAWVERRALTESVALQTRYVLRRVMTEGTGRLANKNANYRMFAKSGTPQMPNPHEGGYYQDRYLPNFIAGAPLDKPRLVILCVIEDPDKSIDHYGGVVAGPVVTNIMNRALEYLGVASDLAADDIQ